MNTVVSSGDSLNAYYFWKILEEALDVLIHKLPVDKRNSKRYFEWKNGNECVSVELYCGKAFLRIRDFDSLSLRSGYQQLLFELPKEIDTFEALRIFTHMMVKNLKDLIDNA